MIKVFNGITRDEVIDKYDWVPTREEIGKEHGSHYDSWSPYPHSDYVKVLTSAIEAHAGLCIKDEKYAVDKSGHKLVGALTIGVHEKGDQLPDGIDFDYSLGFRHANDMSMSHQFFAGAQITACLNGMMTGGIIHARKHTINCNLKDEVGRMLQTWCQQTSHIFQDANNLASWSLSNGAKDQLLMEMGRRGIMPFSRIGKVDQEFREPTFAQFGKRRAWDLYNAATYVVQEASESVQIQTIRDTAQFLQDTYRKVA